MNPGESRRAGASLPTPEPRHPAWFGTIAPGEDIGDPRVRRVTTELVRRAVALIAAYHSDIAQDSPRLRYALECWTCLNRAATRRWLRGEASRDETHELIASTLEHVLRTFGSQPDRPRLRPDRRPDEGLDAARLKPAGCGYPTSGHLLLAWPNPARERGVTTAQP